MQETSLLFQQPVKCKKKGFLLTRIFDITFILGFGDLFLNMRMKTAPFFYWFMSRITDTYMANYISNAFNHFNIAVSLRFAYNDKEIISPLVE